MMVVRWSSVAISETSASPSHGRRSSARRDSPAPCRPVFLPKTENAPEWTRTTEPRSERIFEALGELAGKTQVIVLTHHLHMIDVGNRALGEKLVVQRLPDAAPTLREVLAA